MMVEAVLVCQMIFLSGEARELSTTTIKSFINNIEDLLPDLDNDQEREE